MLTWVPVTTSMLVRRREGNTTGQMSPWGQQSPQVLLPSPEAVAGTFPGQQAGSGNEILPKSKAESSQSDERGVLVWACCRQFLFGQCHIPAAPQLLHREECYLEATHTLLAQVWERFIRP